MTQVLWVGAGGFLGAIARYGVSRLVQRTAEVSSFPLATLIVNVVGCFAIGTLVGLGEDRVPEHLRLFLVVGLLGGFTTFSAFGVDTHGLLRTEGGLHALMNVMLQVVLGLGAVWIGLSLSRAG